MNALVGDEGARPKRSSAFGGLSSAPGERDEPEVEVLHVG